MSQLDWSAPLEAYHPDGRTQDVERYTPDHAQDHGIRPALRDGAFEYDTFAHDGSHYAGRTEWRIRNKMVVTTPYRFKVGDWVRTFDGKPGRVECVYPAHAPSMARVRGDDGTIYKDQPLSSLRSVVSVTETDDGGLVWKGSFYRSWRGDDSLPGHSFEVRGAVENGVHHSFVDHSNELPAHGGIMAPGDLPLHYVTLPLWERIVECLRKSARADGGAEAQAILAEIEPVDPVVKRAREICAAAVTGGSASYFLDGTNDDCDMMRAVITALRTSQP